MAKLNTNTVLPVGVLAGSASQLGQINVPKLGGMLIAVPAPGSIGPTGPASTVPGPQGPTGPMGPKGVDGAGALTASGLGSLVHSAGPVTTVVDADEFAVADSADSFKAKRFSWANLKAAILVWFGPVKATLTNKTLGAGTVYQNSAGSVGFALSGHASNPAHLLFTTGLESGNVQIRTEGVNNCDIVLAPKGGVAGRLDPGGKIIVNTSGAGYDATLLANGVDSNVDWNFIPKGGGTAKVAGVPIVTTTGAQSLSNKTLVSPTFSGGPVVNGANLGGRVSVPATATTASRPGDWAADAAFIYAYTGDGTTHSWVRSAAATW